MNTYLEMYKILYQAYADEIRNLWQRSVFLATFMVLVWTGYGALQLNFIENGRANNFFIDMYHYVSIMLCVVIIILSLLWIAMAKGSKFVQEAHERHIKNLNFDEVKKEPQNENVEHLFCHLNKFDDSKEKNSTFRYKNIDTNPKLFCNGAFKPYRYSPSKINIALGWLSYFLGCLLISYHIGFYAYYIYTKMFKCNDTYYLPYVITASIILILVALLLFCANSMTKNKLKGGNKQQ